MVGESCDSKPTSNCSPSNRRILQHLRPSHSQGLRFQSLHSILSLSPSLLQLQPSFLSYLFQFSNSSSSPFAEGTPLLQTTERGQRIKQTNTKLPEAMLNTGAHGSLFIFSIAIATHTENQHSSHLILSVLFSFSLWISGTGPASNPFRQRSLPSSVLPFIQIASWVAMLRFRH